LQTTKKNRSGTNKNDKKTFDVLNAKTGKRLKLPIRWQTKDKQHTSFKYKEK